MRADRLISLLLLLQRRGTLTAETLASELEVSVRTIYRDVTALSAAGIPVYTTHGPGGGIGLVDRYRTNLTGLSRDQARALFMFTLPEAAVALGVAKDLQAALLKLAAALPAGLQEDEDKVHQRITINLDEDTRPAGVDARLAELHRAVWEDRWVHIRYHSVLRERVPPLERSVMALGLAAQGSRWHLVCQQLDARLVIPTARIIEVQVLESTYERPPDFDLPAFWQTWQTEHAARRPVFPVRLCATPTAARVLGNQYKARQEPAQPGDKRQTWIVIFEHLDEARQALLALGSAVVVLEPLALRLTLVDYARQIIAVHEDEAP